MRVAYQERHEKDSKSVHRLRDTYNQDDQHLRRSKYRRLQKRCHYITVIISVSSSHNAHPWCNLQMDGMETHFCFGMSTPFLTPKHSSRNNVEGLLSPRCRSQFAWRTILWFLSQKRSMFLQDSVSGEQKYGSVGGGTNSKSVLSYRQQTPGLMLRGWVAWQIVRRDAFCWNLGYVAGSQWKETWNADSVEGFAGYQRAKAEFTYDEYDDSLLTAHHDRVVLEGWMTCGRCKEYKIVQYWALRKDE